MSKLTGLLVGVHFNKTGKALLPELPAGTPLGLLADPENPYDPDAIKVMLDPKDIPESRLMALDEKLLEFGLTLEEIMSTGPHQLGHIGASGGKPLSKAKAGPLGEMFPALAGAMEFKEALAAEALGCRGSSTLAFGPGGEPLVEVEWEDGGT